MKSFVQAQGGTVSKANMTDPIAVNYLQTCLRPALGEKVTPRNGKEMSVLAEVLDLLLVGDVVLAAETVLQRFKALETFAHEGDWRLAQHLEVKRASTISCVTARELELAKSTMLMEDRLHRPKNY